MDDITLNNGLKMPLEGFGVFQIPGPTQCEQAVLDAISFGYWVQDASYEGAKAAIQRSLDNLSLDYLDLYLIPNPWRLCRGLPCYGGSLPKEGARAIGVCNFYPSRLADLCETVDVIPAVDQVELHPFFQQEDALALMKEYGVVPEAWGPFAEGKFGIFTHPVLTKIGSKYGKSAAQVALRWNVQRGVVVIPKSVHKERIEQNLDIWDFQLSSERHGEISGLDVGHSEIVSHDDPGFIKNAPWLEDTRLTRAEEQILGGRHPPASCIFIPTQSSRRASVSGQRHGSHLSLRM